MLLLAAYKNASDTYIDSNTQLAIQAARSIYESSGKKVVILLPDGPEYERSSKLFKAALELSDGVSMSHLFEGREPLQKVHFPLCRTSPSQTPTHAT